MPRLSLRLRATLLALTLTVVGTAMTLAWWDDCGEWPVTPPRLIARGHAEGALRVGAAKVRLAVPENSVRAGYAPPRPELVSGGPPLFARALVLQVGNETLALASLDALLVPPTLTEKVRARVDASELDAVHLLPTHTHSGFGGYDPRRLAELAGTGAFRPEAEQVLVEALTEAILQATRSLAPARLEVSLARGDIGIGLRSEGEGPDDRLHLLRFVTEDARHALVLFAAHPTLHPRSLPTLHPDYPGRVSELLEAERGVALYLQGAVGNTVVTLTEGTPGERMERFAGDLVRVATAVKPERHETLRLSHATVEVSLPRPDSTRLAPALFRGAADSLLCSSTTRTTEVSALTLGPLTLLLVPGEVTEAAGRVLEERTGADRILSLADGYLGYVERADRVQRDTGEAHRQYFGPELLERLGQGGRLAVEAAQSSTLGSSGWGR